MYPKERILPKGLVHPIAYLIALPKHTLNMRRAAHPRLPGE